MNLISVMAIENTDLFTMQIYMFLFIGGILFTILGFLLDTETEWHKKVVFHLLAFWLFVPLGMLIFGTGLGLAVVAAITFWGFGVINLFATLYTGAQAMIHFRNKRWS